MLKGTLKTKDITVKTTTRIILANLALTVGLTSCATVTQTSMLRMPKMQTNSAIPMAAKATTQTTPDTHTTPENATNAPNQAALGSQAAAAINQIRSFQISGKIAVQTTKQSGSGTVNWTQRGNQYYISMMGPLGAGGFKLYGRKGFVTLQTSNGKTFTDRNAEHLLAKGWGYHLPVSNLHYWIRGLPSPNMPMKTRYDSHGRLSTLIQQGWIIRYLGYTRRGKFDLPTRLYISSPSLNVKIVIYSWRVS
jgi:outer membrane lipoprotein LolB